tara:strand:- start:51503 stop:51814 length:312 start_codon:yes stop_codon:yes gene_type:complete
MSSTVILRDGSIVRKVPPSLSGIGRPTEFGVRSTTVTGSDIARKVPLSSGMGLRGNMEYWEEGRWVRSHRPIVKLYPRETREDGAATGLRYADGEEWVPLRFG